MKVKDFDRKFDSGENVTRYLKLSAAKRHGQGQKRVNSDTRLMAKLQVGYRDVRQRKGRFVDGVPFLLIADHRGSAY